MKILMFAILILAFSAANAQNLSFNDESTEVKFTTTHGLAKLQGQFKGVKGSAFFNPDHIESSFMKLSFQTAKFTTSDNIMGPSMVKDECFDVSDHPTIQLISSSITAKNKENKYQFRGIINIKGISKQVVFPFTAEPNVGGYDFDFDFSIIRKHFDLDCNFMSKNIQFTVNAYGKRV